MMIDTFPREQITQHQLLLDSEVDIFNTSRSKNNNNNNYKNNTQHEGTGAIRH